LVSLDMHDRIPLQCDREKHLPFDATGAGPGEYYKAMSDNTEKF